VFLGNEGLPYRVERMDGGVNSRMMVRDLLGGHLILKMGFVGSGVEFGEGSDCVILIRMVEVKLRLGKYPLLPSTMWSNRIRGKFYVLSYWIYLDHS